MSSRLVILSHVSSNEMFVANNNSVKTKHVVLIDSADRNTTLFAQGKYTIMLPQEYKQVCTVRLVTAEVPFSFFLNTAANNTTTIILDLGNDPQHIVIPDGSYTVNTLGDAIIAAVARNSTFSHFTLTINIDSTTQKMKLTGSAAFSLDTTTTSTSTAAWGLAYYMGFVKNKVYQSEQLVINAINCTNCVPTKYILLDINMLNNMDETQPVTLTNSSNSYGGNGNVRSTFAKIPLSVAPFDLILFDAGNNLTFNEAILNPIVGKLDRLSITWRHHDGTIIDFNNVDHSLTLEIQCLERGSTF